MTIQQKISIPLADLSESIGDGLALAFRRMRASDDFDEFLSALRSDGTDIEELNGSLRKRASSRGVALERRPAKDHCSSPGLQQRPSPRGSRFSSSFVTTPG